MNIYKIASRYTMTRIAFVCLGLSVAATAHAVPLFNFTGDPSSSGLGTGNLATSVTATDETGAFSIDIFGFNADPAASAFYAPQDINRNATRGLGVRTQGGSNALNTDGTRSEGLLFDFSGVDAGLRPEFVDFQGLGNNEEVDIYGADLGADPEDAIAGFTYADLILNMTLIGTATNANTDSNDVFVFPRTTFPHLFIAIVADGENDDRARIQAIGVPEPATLGLLGLALAGFSYQRRRRAYS